MYDKTHTQAEYNLQEYIPVSYQSRISGRIYVTEVESTLHARQYLA